MMKEFSFAHRVIALLESRRQLTVRALGDSYHITHSLFNASKAAARRPTNPVDASGCCRE
jgi:hypothetical protein